MRKIKEVLRLKFELGLGHRQIARSCSIGVATVHEYLSRANQAGIGWPLAEDWDEQRVEAALYGDKPGGVRQPERNAPDFSAIHEQRQKSKHVTLQLLWEEYREANPDGYHYAEHF